MSLYHCNRYLHELDTEVRRTDVPWSMLNNKKVLITGASGMIGSYLTDLIMMASKIYGNQTHVFALSRNEDKLRRRFVQYEENSCFHYVVQDIMQELSFEGDYDIDYIIHAASNTHPKEYSSDPVGTILTNVIGFYNVLEYAKESRRRHTCRIVLCSSVEIYGENRTEKDYFREDDLGYIDCNTLRSGYPESKRVSESMIQAYIKQYHMDAVSVRLSRVYGASLEKDDSKAMTQFIRNAIRGEDIVLKSSGTQLYSYNYIADAARAILMVMLEGKSGNAYNVADSNSDSMLKDIATYLANYCGSSVVFQIADQCEREGYSTATKALLDSSKIKQELNWKAYYPLEEGLVRTIEILKEEEYK